MPNFDFFNGLAEKWDSINPCNAEKIKIMLDLLFIKPDDKILDVGTGTGILIPFLLKKTSGKNITAVDGAEKMIEKAKQKHIDTAVNFIVSDIMECNFKTESFNHIICYSIFPHLNDKQNAVRCFSELLTKDGLLSILHSESKEAINRVHSAYQEVSSDSLKSPAAYIPLFNHAGLYEEIVLDNSEMYMLCCRKR